ncbi:sigma factor-like helix-turn-helix DNA-binding protein [Streptomyces sp. NPDC050433]|uniref:sigma factor-like helix-turn-helix DNA-binding protein n=1 Tax=Streptomyces sp. NPDC050433 TaxID=3365615 RepID=UPI0037B09949
MRKTRQKVGEQRPVGEEEHGNGRAGLPFGKGGRAQYVNSHEREPTIRAYERTLLPVGCRFSGQWIPEPLPEPTEWVTGRPGDATLDPADRITLDESVNMAFLVVLESMTPAERVAFILHDVFRYAFAEIAEITGRTPAACRQLASTARRRVRVSQEAPATPTARQAGIVRDFKRAWETTDIAALIGLLDPDATMTADSGGLVRAVLHPIEGGAQIARTYADITNAAPPGLTIRERTVNGRPGLVSQFDGVTVTVFAFHVVGDRIKHIWAVRNPEKLRTWTDGQKTTS